MTLRAILFDFDGLMMQTETAYYGGWKAVYDEYGVELPMDYFVKMIGGGFGHNPFQFLADQTNKPIDEKAIWKRVMDVHWEMALDEPLMPGVQQWIDDARKMGLRMAVASSSPHSWIDFHMKRVGVWDDFQAVICRDDVPLRKPAPDLYVAAMRALEVQPEDCLVLEDSEHGVDAAIAAGVYVVVVPHHFTEHMEVSHANRSIPSLAEVSLADVIRGMEEERSRRA